MGVTLFIRRANFATNSIPDSELFVSFPNVSNNVLSITSKSAGCVNLNDNNNSKRLMLSDISNGNYLGILIPAGKSITIKGLKGNDGNSPALQLDYCYMSAAGIVTSSYSISSRNPNLVGTASNFVSSDYFLINTEGNDKVTLTNNYGADYYFAFTCKNSSGTATPSSSYSGISFKIA